ncbi:MAG: OmpA family protein, partial [Bacteroidetes bacterium]|nr:OmpA family protein [Fibrella sp.]
AVLMGILVMGLLLEKCREPQTSTSGVLTDTTARVESDAQEDTAQATRDNINKSFGSNADSTKGALGMPVDGPDSTKAKATGDKADKPEVRTQIELPGGRRLKLTENSFTLNLARFLASKPTNPARTFTFDNLTFDTGSARITSESQPNVNDLIEIMKAYPALAVRIEGHTDNQGDASVNKKLSLDRAVAVKTALTAAGIETNRVLTQGFGPAKPTASNDTETGRRKNRRIDVVVTKL